MLTRPSIRHPGQIRRWLSREVLARVVADILMINVVLGFSLVLHYLWVIGTDRFVGSAHDVLLGYIQAYLTTFWMLTPISLVIFHLSGFYSYSRFYESRYKILVITQAVSLSYLVFSFFLLLLRDVVMFPRSVLIVGWLLTLITLLGARLWLMTWVNALRKEQPFVSAPTVVAGDRIRNVLVIGGAGYIGSALLPRLLEKGYNVRLLDLLLFGPDPIRPVIGHPHLEIVYGDFLQMDQVVKAMRGMDAVIHLGAIVGDPACELSTGMTIEVNLMATRMIAEVARCMKVNRMIFASTCSVYGASNAVLDEHSALNPVSLYASSKIASEKVLLSLAGSDFSPVILRFGTVYGLSGRTRFDLVINLLTAKAAVDRKITVFGGDQWRPFVHVDDAAHGILMVIEAPLSVVRGQIFNVGSNEQNYTIRQVAEIIKGIVPEAEIEELGQDSDLRNYRVSFNKIQRTIGFTPAWTVEQGVQQVLDAIRSGRVEDYQSPKYSNLKYLREQGMIRLGANGRQLTYDLLTETLESAHK